jgi:hypothetical protein
MEDAARRPRNDRDLADLMVRRDALRQSAALPGAQLPQVLEAAFAELDGAIEMAAARGAAAAGRIAHRGRRRGAQAAAGGLRRRSGPAFPA